MSPMLRVITLQPQNQPDHLVRLCDFGCKEPVFRKDGEWKVCKGCSDRLHLADMLLRRFGMVPPSAPFIANRDKN